MGLIDKRDPVCKVPKYPPTLLLWQAAVDPGLPSYLPANVQGCTSLTSTHFLEFTLTEPLDCSPSNLPLRPCEIVSGSVQLNTNERAAITLDNGQAVLV